MKNGDCMITADLYDLYIDDALSEDSKKFVKKHLEECEKCHLILEKKENVTIVSSNQQKTVKTRRIKLPANVAFVVVLLMCIAVVPFTFVCALFPDIILPSCFTGTVEIKAVSDIENTQEECEEAAESVRYALKKNHAFDGSTLKEIYFKKTYKFQYYGKYNDYDTKDIMWADCTLNFYTNIQNMGVGIGSDVDVRMYVVRENGEWTAYFGDSIEGGAE